LERPHRRGSGVAWPVPQSRHEWHWDRARTRFDIADDAVYEDDEARVLAEDGILDEALDHWAGQMGWRAPSGHRQNVTIPQLGRRDWSNRPTVRDLDFERNLTVYELNVARAKQRRSEKAGRVGKRQARQKK
jgi:hypothetical protein